MLRRRILRAALVLATLSGVLVVLSTTASATRTTAVPFPKQLVGFWSRNVTAADIRRAGAKHAVTPGVWNVDVNQAKSGTYGNVYIGQTGRRRPPLGGTIVPLGPGRVYVVVGFPSGSLPGPPNEWRWKVAGKLLTLTRVRDPNPDRVAFFAGTWKKVG